MKKINIIGSQIVKKELRYQHENPITTTNAEAQRLYDGGMLRDAPVDTDGTDPEPDPVEVAEQAMAEATDGADNG